MNVAQEVGHFLCLYFWDAGSDPHSTGILSKSLLKTMQNCDIYPKILSELYDQMFKIDHFSGTTRSPSCIVICEERLISTKFSVFRSKISSAFTTNFFKMVKICLFRDIIHPILCAETVIKYNIFEFWGHVAS